MNGKIYKYFNRKKFEEEGIKKYYIGQTTRTIKQRAGKDGIYYTKDNDNEISYSKFANAIRKWGWDAFEVEILEENISSLEELNKLEIFYIEKYNSFNEGYNSTLGGDGVTGCKHTGMYGKEFTDEHRKKLSESHKGLQSGESHPMYGKKHTEESRQKIKEARAKQESSGMKGLTHTDETKKIIGEKSKQIQARSDVKEKNRQHALGNKFAKRRKVYSKELDLEFECIEDAKRYMKKNYNIKADNIQAVCQGKRASCGKINNIKITWEYRD